MKDTQLYEQLLGLSAPWSVSRVELELERNRITGGGVTAGIDFGLHLARVLAGEDVAQRIQLSIEYAPAPPFQAGSPATAPAAVLDEYATRAAPKMERRQQAVATAAARLAELGRHAG